MGQQSAKIQANQQRVNVLWQSRKKDPFKPNSNADSASNTTLPPTPSTQNPPFGANSHKTVEIDLTDLWI